MSSPFSCNALITRSQEQHHDQQQKCNEANPTNKAGTMYNHLFLVFETPYETIHQSVDPPMKFPILQPPWAKQGKGCHKRLKNQNFSGSATPRRRNKSHERMRLKKREYWHNPKILRDVSKRWREWFCWVPFSEEVKKKALKDSKDKRVGVVTLLRIQQRY